MFDVVGAKSVAVVSETVVATESGLSDDAAAIRIQSVSRRKDAKKRVAAIREQRAKDKSSGAGDGYASARLHLRACKISSCRVYVCVHVCTYVSMRACMRMFVCACMYVGVGV